MSRLICWLKGHDYRHYFLVKEKTKYKVDFYACQRCGWQPKYQEQEEE